MVVIFIRNNIDKTEIHFTIQTGDLMSAKLLEKLIIGTSSHTFFKRFVRIEKPWQENPAISEKDTA